MIIVFVDIEISRFLVRDSPIFFHAMKKPGS